MKRETKKLEISGIDFPVWGASYLMNGDTSGVSEHGARYVDEFHAHICENYGEPIYVLGNETYFRRYPCIGLATDCLELTVIILNPKHSQA